MIVLYEPTVRFLFFLPGVGSAVGSHMQGYFDKTGFFGVFPMFVTSLSWQKDDFYIDI